MPRRTFGPAAGSVQGKVSGRKEQESHVEETSSPKTNKANSGGGFLSTIKKPFVLIPACAALLIGSGVGIYKVGFDSGNGASSPEVVAASFVQAASGRSDAIWSHIPSGIRDAKTGSSSALWEMNDNTYIELSDVTAVKSSKAVDASALSDGYESVYHQSVDVKDAVLMDMHANAKTVGGDVKPVDFNMICVKVGWRWYVYTGADIKGVTAPYISIMASLPGSGQTDDNASVINVPAVTPYDNALSDLKAGIVSIDGKAYTMPCRYNNMTSVFTLADEAIDAKDRTLTENMILKFLPVMYNEQVSSCFFVDIANPDPKDVDLAEGVVSTLQIRRPSDNEKMADVVLPGNVTLGTSLSDVVSVYGEMESYATASEHDADLDSFGYNSSGTYRIRITEDNDYNWIYLIFDENDTLYAVEWRYYDLSVIL